MLLDLFLLSAGLGLAFIVYLLRKHAGILVLAALAGGAWSTIMTGVVTDWLITRGSLTIDLSPEALAGATLTILPVVLVWVAAPTTHVQWRRIAGSLIVGFLTVDLLLGFAPDLIDENLVAASRIYDLGAHYSTWFVTLCLGYAIIDLYLSKLGGHASKPKK